MHYVEAGSGPHMRGYGQTASKPIDAVADKGRSEAFIPVPIHVLPDVFYH